MTRKTFFILLISIYTLTTYAQKENIEFGAKAGINYTNLISNYPLITDFKPNIGFYAGVFFTYNINQKIAIRPELLYTLRKTKINIDDQHIISSIPQDPVYTPTTQNNIKDNILLLPILVEYHLGNKIALEAGPQIGYALSTKTEMEDSSWYYNHSEKFEMGLSAGLLYAFTTKIAAELKYTYGTERSELNSSSFQLGVNYKI